jgi:hypothetical protein
MILRGPKSMRKVGGLNPILIDFYVPALTPSLNSTETSLQLSENIILFAVCRIYAVEVTLQLSLYSRGTDHIETTSSVVWIVVLPSS